jgi:hypothetical protein
MVRLRRRDRDGRPGAMRIVHVALIPINSEVIFMRRFLGAALAIMFVTGTGRLVWADDKDPSPILEKAIKALGGEEKLKKVGAYSWKSKLTITFDGNKNDFNSSQTIQGIDHYRSEFTGEFGGNAFKGITVVNGDKGWQKFGDNAMVMDEDALANEKRRIYLSIIPSQLVPLKDKGFKIEVLAEEKVGDKPAAGLKVTGPDKKDFTIFFDKESGLPVKVVAKVIGFQGDEFTQSTTFKDYKDFDGIKRATKADSKRDGEDFVSAEMSEFKILDKVDPKTFAEPE